MVNEISEKKWQDFVEKHPYGNVFQLPVMFKVYQKTMNYQPIKVFLVDDKENIHGLVSAVIFKEKGGLIGALTARAVIQGGPLFRQGVSKKTINQLMSSYDELVRHQAVFSEIRNLNENLSRPKNLIAGYTFEDHLDFLISLENKEEEIYHQIHESTRKHIKRAVKKEVILEELKDPRKIPSCYRLLLSTYARAKIPLSDASLFKAAWQVLVPSGLAKFFLAKCNGRLIGTRMVLTYRDTIYDWYAGADSDFLNFYPNEFLVWQVLKWGMAKNFKVFDFGGAGKPNVPYGPREFKRRFGGKMVNFGRNTKIYSPLKYQLLNFGLMLYQKFFKMLNAARAFKKF